MKLLILSNAPFSYQYTPAFIQVFQVCFYKYKASLIPFNKHFEYTHNPIISFTLYFTNLMLKSPNFNHTHTHTHTSRISKLTWKSSLSQTSIWQTEKIPTPREAPKIYEIKELITLPPVLNIRPNWLFWKILKKAK